MTTEPAVCSAGLAAALTIFAAGKDTYYLRFLLLLVYNGGSTTLVSLADTTLSLGELHSASCRLIQGQTCALPSTLASSSVQSQLSPAIRNTSLKSLRPQRPLTDPRTSLMAAPAIGPFTLQAKMNITSITTGLPAMPAAVHKDAASRHISTGGQTKTICNKLLHCHNLHLSFLTQSLSVFKVSLLSQMCVLAIASSYFICQAVCLSVLACACARVCVCACARVRARQDSV